MSIASLLMDCERSSDAAREAADSAQEAAQRAQEAVSSGFPYALGDNLQVMDNVLSVKMAHQAEQDNTLPITAAAVYTEVGNINALLQTI